MSPWKLKMLPVGPLLTNAYLLYAADPSSCDEALLVDPGGDPDHLLREIDNTGCRLTGLLATHGHFDHIAATAMVQREYDLPLLCHPDDGPMIEQMPAIQRSYGFPESPIPRYETSLSDGQTLAFAGDTLAVSHIPGHSPGQVMFSWADGALVGDCIFAGSVGRTDLPGGSFALLEKSIRERIYTLPDTVVLYSGHGPETTVGRERMSNPFVSDRAGL